MKSRILFLIIFITWVILGSAHAQVVTGEPPDQPPVKGPSGSEEVASNIYALEQEMLNSLKECFDSEPKQLLVGPLVLETKPNIYHLVITMKQEELIENLNPKKIPHGPAHNECKNPYDPILFEPPLPTKGMTCVKSNQKLKKEIQLFLSLEPGVHEKVLKKQLNFTSDQMVETLDYLTYLLKE